MARKKSCWVCSTCKPIRIKANIERYHIKHPGRANALERIRYQQNPKPVRERSLNYLHSLPKEVRAKKRAYNRQYHKRNRDERVKYCKQYSKDNRGEINNATREYNTKPQNKIAARLRCRIRNAVRLHQGIKSAHTEDLTGCSFEDLVSYLEKLFKPRMTWENYGKGPDRWCIDHIKPCDSFDLTDPEQQRLCFHFSNLQPLWFSENSIKGAKTT